MQKEKNHRVFRKLFSAMVLSIVVTSQSFSQENNIITISSDEVQVLNEKYKELKIFKAEQKEIEFYPYEIGQVPNQEYLMLTEKMDRYQKSYDEYNDQISYNKAKREDIDKIFKYIDDYESSKEKYKVKSEYLEKAQALADKYEFDFTIREKTLASQLLSNSPSGFVTRNVKLYDSKKKTSNSDLDFFKQNLKKISIYDPGKSYGYTEYVKHLNLLESTPKTVEGKVLSSTKSKRLSYVIDDTSNVDLSELQGTFNIIPNLFRICKDIEGYYIKNELTTKHENKNGCSGAYHSYSILQNTETNELYYVMNTNFVASVKEIKVNDELKTIATKLGYTIEGNNIKTKTSKLLISQWLYDELKTNPNYIKELDNDYLKILELTKQMPQHSKTLDKYIGQYRIQRNKMSTADINSWRNATSNAQNLYVKVQNLREKYEKYFWNIKNDITKSGQYSDFLDNLLASEGVLGM